MRTRSVLASSIVLALVALAPTARAADLAVGVAPSSLKVRPADTPTLAPSAKIAAARNEFEAFQIVLRAASGDVSGVVAKLSSSLVGPAGARIPDANVTLYAERYYDVGTPSNDEGASGPWPDPLVPAVDTYFGETRNAFPLTVPSGQTRVVWVDVLVPIDQTPGDYAGAIDVEVGGSKLASVPVQLHVGNFTLPSTATLGSAFGMGWGTAPQVHCGGSFPFCASEDAANAIRALYVRAALEHRVTISNTDFQPPFGGSAAPYEKYVLPMIEGTAPTRLPGAKLTTVVLDGGDNSLPQWIAYAKSKGFFDRLFYYPVDEPGTNGSMWQTFTSESHVLHADDPAAQICLTTSIQDADNYGASGSIDIFVPVLDQMYGRSGSGYDGDQRSKYDAWLSSKPNRKLWMYQSCDQHGCGACGDPSPGTYFTGWPQRVIDSSGVQDRAFPWIAFEENVTAELYFSSDYQLGTAWDAGGQCAFSGSGDGTIFYPGKPSIIGGTKDIPIESLRLKLIREGMEDYEYLAMVAKKDAALAKQIATGLFPKAYDCAKKPADLEAARAKLFAALDTPLPPPAGGDAGASGGGDAGSSGGGPIPQGGGGASGADGGAAGGAMNGGAPSDDMGGCSVARGADTNGFAAIVIALAGVLAARRRRVTAA